MSFSYYKIWFESLWMSNAYGYDYYFFIGIDLPLREFEVVFGKWILVATFCPITMYTIGCLIS